MNFEQETKFYLSSLIRLVGKSEPQICSNRADSHFDYNNRNTPTPIQYN